MSEKDVTAKEYLENKQRIADIINVVYHNGQQIVLPEHIHTRKCIHVIQKGTPDKRTSKEFIRDIANTVAVQSNTANISIEVQSEVHYAMPLRVLGGDYAGYQEQWRKIKAAHENNKDLKGAEYISRFSKEDKLILESTIVLYMGQKPWDGPRCLQDMLNLEGLPNSMKAHIGDYPLYIIDVRRYQEYEKFTTDLKYVFGFLQKDQSDEELHRYLYQNKGAFSHLAEDAFDLIAQYSGSWKKLKEYKTENYKKEGELDMCKAIDDLIAKGEKRGYDNGYGKGNIHGIMFVLKKFGYGKNTALSSLMESMKITKEKAEEYVNLYW